MPPPQYPPPISAMKLRLTSPALTVPLEEPITSADSGPNNIPITNEDIIGHFNNQPPGTISNPSIIATYDNPVFPSGSNPVTVVSESNYVPFPITPTFSFAEITDRLTTSSSFSIAPLITKQGTGVVSYVSSDLSVATVHSSSGQIVITGPGFTDITATLAASADKVYTAAPSPLTRRLTVYRDTATLTNFPNIVKNYNDSIFAPVTPSSLSDGLFTYTVRVESGDDTDVAEIVNNQVKVNNAGRVTLRATQAQTNTWNENFVECKLTVNPIDPELSGFSDITKNYQDANFNLSNPSSNSSGAFTFKTVDANNDEITSDVATVSGRAVTVLNVGEVTIRATQAATRNYISASRNTTLTVSPIDPQLSGFSNITKNYQDANFNLSNPSSNSSGAFTFKTVDANNDDITSDVATVSVVDSVYKVTVLNAGTATIRATQNATRNYISASINTTLTVNPIDPQLRGFSNITKNYQAANFDLSNPTSNSSGTFIFKTVDANNNDLTSDVATVLGRAVTVLNVGEVTIRATQNATRNYISASINTTLTVNPIDPQLSGFSNITENYQAANFNLSNPTSNSSGTFTFKTVDANNDDLTSDVATVSVVDSVYKVTVLNAGTVTIRATQDATRNFNSASKNATLTVNQISPGLNSFSIQSKPYQSAAFIIPPPLSDNADGAFSYVSNNTDVALISGDNNDEITVVNQGNARITVTQAETRNYLSESVYDTFVVTRIDPVITGFSISAVDFQEDPFNITLTPPNTTNNDPLGVFTYEIIGTNDNVASVSGNTITVSNSGTVTVKATQEQTRNYNSKYVTADLVVNKISPVLTNFSIPPEEYNLTPFEITLADPTSTNEEAGGDFTFEIITDENPDNANTATVSGRTVTINNAGSVTVIATQRGTRNYLSASVNATLEVNTINPSLSASDIQKNYSLTEYTFELTDPTTNNEEDGGTFTFNIISDKAIDGITLTDSNNPSATLSGTDNRTVTVKNVGIVTIRATQAATDNFNSHHIDIELTINPIDPTITFNNIAKSYQATNFDFDLTNPTSNSSGTFTFKIVDANNNDITLTSDVATLSVVDSVYKVTVLNAGEVTIVATQGATRNFNSASKNATLTVSRIDPTFGAFNAIVKTFGDGSFTLNDPENLVSDGAISFLINDDNVRGTIATLGNTVRTVTIVKAGGPVTVVARQDATRNYNLGTTSTTLTVNRAPTSITVNTSSLIRTFVTDDDDFLLPDAAGISKTAGSTGVLAYASSNASVATINASTGLVSIVAAGVVTFTVSLPDSEDGNWAAASDKTVSLTVNRAPTSITVVTNSLTKTFGDAGFSLVTAAGISKTAGSTGVLAYASSNASIATINSSTGLVSIVAVGSVDFTVSLAASADGNWAAASDKTVSLTVDAPAEIIRASNNVTIRYTGDASAVLSSSARFLEANLRGTGMEWFAIVKDDMKQAITDYANGLSGSSTPFTPPEQSQPVPFSNIVTTLMTDMSYMFQNASTFNEDISEWDVSSVTNMYNVFDSAWLFNRPLNYWNVSKVESMNSMFKNAEVFNQPLNLWDVSSVKYMGIMFANAKLFNQDISMWNVSLVEDMDSMFINTEEFDQPLNSWNTSKVVNMAYMFENAKVFNQPLNSWNTSKVENMKRMFLHATLFNQDISMWDVSSVLIRPPIWFSDNSALTAENTPIWFP